MEALYKLLVSRAVQGPCFPGLPELLYLLDLPGLPNLPYLPNLPDLLNLTYLPNLQDLPELSDLPNLPSSQTSCSEREIKRPSDQNSPIFQGGGFT